MQEESTLVLIMGSIHRVLKAETLLKKADLPVEVVVTPRELSSDCGMVVTLPAVRREEVLAVLQAASLEWDQMFLRKGPNYEEVKA